MRVERRQDELAARFVRFWATVLVYHYILPLKRIPQREAEFGEIANIYDCILEAAGRHGLIPERMTLAKIMGEQ